MEVDGSIVGRASCRSQDGSTEEIAGGLLMTTVPSDVLVHAARETKPQQRMIARPGLPICAPALKHSLGKYTRSCEDRSLRGSVRGRDPLHPPSESFLIRGDLVGFVGLVPPDGTPDGLSNRAMVHDLLSKVNRLSGELPTPVGGPRCT
jgi:hypothetical protein